MDADIGAALNGLLEEERAGAETLVGLVAMATDPFERQALTAMGGQAAEGCIELRAWLARLGVPISLRVAHSVSRVLGRERIDDRLRAFGEARRYLAGRCEALQERNLDDGTRTLLAALRAVQLAHAAWAEHRASDFAATRPGDAESSSPSHSTPRGERAPVAVAVADGAQAAEMTDTLALGERDAPEAVLPYDSDLAEAADAMAAGGMDGPASDLAPTDFAATDLPVEVPPPTPRAARRTATKPRVRPTPLTAPAAKRRGKQTP
jgi:hypothetical protein